MMIGVTSLYHSLTPKKANEKRTLVITPVINSYRSVLASRRMKMRFLFLGLLLCSSAAAQDKPSPSGSVYGVVVTSAGERAKRLTLAAMPLGVALSSKIPQYQEQ